MAKSIRKKLLITIPIVLVCLYLLACTLLYNFQEYALFPGYRLGKQHFFNFPTHFSEHYVEHGEDSLNVLWFDVHEGIDEKGTVVYYHGNGGALDMWGTIYPDFIYRGYNLCVYDYPGYGKSTNSINSQEQLLGGAQAIYDFAKSRTTEDKLVVYGRSIGSGIASKIAHDNSPALLLLETPYYSMLNTVHHHNPFMPTRLMLKYPLPTFEWVENLPIPWYQIHGTADKTIPFSQAQKLSALAGKDNLTVVEGGGHELSDAPEFEAFLTKYLGESVLPQ